jgi:D-3-phosphoglycerate dehydrogenase
LILSAARHIPEEVQALKEGRWQTTLGTGLAGKTLGVYAYGRIGSIVAQVGRAFGMKVICWGRDGSTAKAKEAGFEVAASREAFFENADVVSLHIPLNKDTQGIVTAADLARMKPDAILVNTSRAPLIEAGALLAALKAGRPGRAAVDVYETEPVLRGAHPLLKLPNVVATPHLGYVEKDTYEALFGAATDQVLAFAAGKPINVVAT